MKKAEERNRYTETQKEEHVHEVNPLCDARRREKVGALYSAVLSLLTFIDRACPQLLSPAPWNVRTCSPGSSAVIVVLNQEIHLHKRQNTTACL